MVTENQMFHGTVAHEYSIARELSTGVKKNKKNKIIIIIMVASAFHTDVFVNKAKIIDISQVFRGKAGVFVVF